MNYVIKNYKGVYIRLKYLIIPYLILLSGLVLPLIYHHKYQIFLPNEKDVDIYFLEEYRMIEYLREYTEIFGNEVIW